jgi:macrolide-specific efflux system membrane fusion protein
MKLFANIKNKFLSLPKFLRIIILIISIASIGYFIYSRVATSNNKVTYKTTQVAKGNIISTISTSGSITSGSNTSIYTSASGQVIKVYVKNGDTVKQGQQIAKIALDQDGQKKQNLAWASYLTAKNSLDSAKQNKLTLQNQLDSAQLAVDQAQDAVNKIDDYTKTDLQKEVINTGLTTNKRSLTVAQSKYAAADLSVAIAQAQLSAAWYSYQQASATITAPANGVLTNFSLTAGMSVANLAASSNSTTDATQSVGIITNPKNQITASVSLTEIDVTKVKAGQKATLTLDAFPDKSFTGQVLAINTNGQSSSGVTSYPTIIILDSSLPNMYPNMSVSANIIIDSKTDILTIPTSAIKTTNGESFVQIQKDNQISSVIVQTGISDTTNTEIISGLNEGDIVITSTSTSISKNTTTSTTNKSVFSSSGMGGGFGR